ncbi:glycosyltransferase [Pseudoroseomonas ludipueritiae]
MSPLPGLLLLAAPEDDLRPLVEALSRDWSVTTCIPRALWRYAGADAALAELRRQARGAALVLHLSADGAAALAGLEGLVEVYAPADLALCHLSPAERTDPEAWEALWRRERDLARRARLLVVPAEEVGRKLRLLYGVPAERLREVPRAALPRLLAALPPPAPAEGTPPGFTLALNDYPVIEKHTGGAVRVRHGLAALGEETVLLSLGNVGATAFVAPNVLQVSVPKDRGQRAVEADLRTLADSGLEDIVSAMHAASHPTLLAVAADLSRRARVAVFEHCYLAPLLDAMHAAAPGLPVVYDAHNVEARLKREILAGHPAEAPLCGFVEEVERRLLAAADLVLCCSEADAAHFGPAARQVVLMPHGVILAEPAAPVAGEAPRLGFLGSSHPPNVAAARFIVEELAPRLPEAVFELVGSVCAAVSSNLPNVLLRGVVSEEEKAATLGRWSVALNPVESGSGASLKLADYLAHGLPTVNTPHAARGFAAVAAGAGLVLPLEGFAPELSRLLRQPGALRDLAARAREAAEAQGWSATARPAREAIAALAAAHAPAPSAPALLAVDEGAATAWRSHPGFGRIDLLPEADAVPRPLLADRLLAPAGAGPGPAVTPRRPCLAYGVEPGGHPVAEEWGLLLPAGSRRLRLELKAEAPLFLRLRCGPAGQPDAAVTLLEAPMDGPARLGLPLPEAEGPLLLQASVAGPAAALRLRSAGLLLPEPWPIDLSATSGAMEPPRTRWLHQHAGRYAALVATRGGPLPPGLPPRAAVTGAMILAPAAALLAEAASARHAVAARMALGLEQPFLLVVGEARPWDAATCPGAATVRHTDGEASHQDADGIQRRVPVPVAALLLSRDPPCCHLLLGTGPEPLRDGLVALASLAGVPFSVQEP